MIVGQMHHHRDARASKVITPCARARVIQSTNDTHAECVGGARDENEILIIVALDVALRGTVLSPS